MIFSSRSIVRFPAALMLAFGLSAAFPMIADADVNPQDKVLARQVIELAPYTSLDSQAGEQFLEKRFDGWRRGGCTAAVKTMPSGDTVAGRNLDLYISNHSAYIVRTAVPGELKTLRLTYSHSFGPDFDDFWTNGLSDEERRVLPFGATDVLNEKGLYIEINMRTNEVYPDGTDKFSCPGTNPGKKRVSAMGLPSYLAARCATVKEAVALVKELDIYTIKNAEMTWPFCFLMADATGNFGVLELGANEAVWLPRQSVQTNFYITPRLEKVEAYKSGLGRYALVTKGLRKVSGEKGMMELMKKVTYSQAYDPANAAFDVRSEFVGGRPHWSSDYLLSQAGKKEFEAWMAGTYADAPSMDRDARIAKGGMWESVYTSVVNCRKKTMTVRFFEDDERVFTLGF
ncbi:MAG: linear amide C-N hydrolase [Mailhella sp.]|nr:linear amide C-N hydrolase [Mailhella sp.]